MRSKPSAEPIEYQVDVEPPDLGRRGAGADAGAHRLGTATREAGDLSAGVYDTEGRMLAQAVTGTPGPRQLDGDERGLRARQGALVKIE